MTTKMTRRQIRVKNATVILNPRFRDVEIKSMGSMECTIIRNSMLQPGATVECRTRMSLDLFLVREAWEQGCDFEDLADGYGVGAGTHGDWSGIRDSSPRAKSAMLQRALNWLFPEAD